MSQYCWTTNILSPEKYPLYGSKLYLKLPFFNSEHVAFSYCACSTLHSGWAYNRVKTPSCKNFEAKEGMGVYSRWAYFREGTVHVYNYVCTLLIISADISTVQHSTYVILVILKVIARVSYRREPSLWYWNNSWPFFSKHFLVTYQKHAPSTSTPVWHPDSACFTCMQSVHVYVPLCISSAGLLVGSYLHVYNESTAGAGASVEVSKLHNIKLLAISNSFILTHIIIMNNFAILLHALIVRQNPESQRNSKSG